MFHVKEKNSIDFVGKKYVPACTNVGSGNIFAGKAKVRFVKEAVQTLDVIEEGDTAYEGSSLVSNQRFGEAISLVSEATNTDVITVVGYDYLGQRMVEEITLTSATEVAGKKAFKAIVAIKGTAAQAKKVSLKTNGKMGLAFAAVSKDFVVKNGVADSTAAITAGAFTQTATSADPRGLLSIAHASTNDVIECVYNTTDYVKPDGHGGLFGVPHFAE